MMDLLLQTATAIKAWPKGSNARTVQVKALQTMIEKRRGEVSDAEDLLKRQWRWLDENESTAEPERFSQKESIFLTTLADYEDLSDGLQAAEAVLATT